MDAKPIMINLREGEILCEDGSKFIIVPEANEDDDLQELIKNWDN